MTSRQAAAAPAEAGRRRRRGVGGGGMLLPLLVAMAALFGLAAAAVAVQPPSGAASAAFLGAGTGAWRFARPGASRYNQPQQPQQGQRRGAGAVVCAAKKGTQGGGAGETTKRTRWVGGESRGWLSQGGLIFGVGSVDGPFG